MDVYLDTKLIAEIQRSEVAINLRKIYSDHNFVDRAFRKLNKIFRGFKTEARLFRRNHSLFIEVKGRKFPVYWNDETHIIDFDGDFFGNVTPSS